MKFTFEIMGRLPGLNDIIDTARDHHFASAKQKKKMTQLCAFWVNAAKVPKFMTPVAISFGWIEPNRRRDIDNIAGGGTKFILDALVQLARIPGDSQKWVTKIEHFFHEPDVHKPRVIVTIDDGVTEETKP